MPKNADTAAKASAKAPARMSKKDPLTKEQLHAIDAWWRAANYLSACQLYLLDNPLLLAQMFIPLLIFFAVLFFVAQLVGRLQKFPKKDIVALNMTTLARNSPLSLAIAVVTFPEQPLVSLALVIGPLIELPVLSVISGILKRWNNN